ncbi:GntR family transcriptional regulator [Microtetraspora sp. AC03309]|uniref:GntR family transcriptional regulator n=1 Tax=Microtetraspora sp. AC03309 TaxID=2779376 RepID=UPI001E55BDF5|nr:GntR family transcriptional regulator [Microtetraspora sp. AC03309]MCC5576362.1 GntR family transcriptional regulator [Microtetraspora sp. AC03309]
MADARHGAATAPLPAADRAYDFTKELIVSGRLQGGTLISEGEIAEQVGVSRTPVREAFLRLQAEELLRLFPKRGAVVVPLAPGEAEDVIELREALECSAARRLLRLDDDALGQVVERLRETVRAQSGPARRLDTGAFARADQAFHLAIVAASGNGLAERFYASLGDRQLRMAAQALQPRPERLAVLVREHGALVDAIAGRDVPRFEESLRAHLDATHRAFAARRP